ncbi:MAG TPA: hypothetical protein VLF39_01415 [Candidatus Saccharimonadales bacterium]|nr:hypothetical protein [Candidatus Saccharimonadales bacterium]
MEDLPTEPQAMLEMYLEASDETKLLLGQLARDLITNYVDNLNPLTLPKIVLPDDQDIENYTDEGYFFRGVLFDIQKRQIGSGEYQTHSLLTEDHIIIATTIVHPDQSISDDDNWQYYDLGYTRLEDPELALKWASYGQKALRYLANQGNLSVELVDEKNRVEQYDKLRAV